MTPEPKNRREAWRKVSRGGSIRKQHVGGVSCLTNEPHRFMVQVSKIPQVDKKAQPKFFVLFYSDLYGGLTVNITAEQVLSYIRREFPRHEAKSWRSATHHHGLYTFDWCTNTRCDDPTHFVDGETPAYDKAVEMSRKREAVRALSRSDDTK